MPGDAAVATAAPTFDAAKSPAPAATAASPPSPNADERLLLSLGYRQELRRAFSTLTAFGFSFSVLSFLTALTGSWDVAWFSGGPVSAVWGWVLVSALTFFVAVSMAELVSAYPTSGGLYYMSAKLGGAYSHFASYTCGWFNLLGIIAASAGAAFACASLIAVAVVFATSPARANRHGGLSMASFLAQPPAVPGQPILARPEPCPFDASGALVTASPWPSTDVLGGAFSASEVAFSASQCALIPVHFSPPARYGLFLAVLVGALCVNSASASVLRATVTLATVWHVVGASVVIAALPAVAPTHADAATIFALWVPNTAPPVYGAALVPLGGSIFRGDPSGGASVEDADINSGGNGLPGGAAVFAVGILMSQWCFTGYDVCCHVSEETRDAATSSPRALMRSILVTAVAGLAYIFAILASVTDVNNAYSGPFAINLSSLGQIWWDAFESRYGNGRWVLLLWVVPIGAAALTTACAVTGASRMLFAFARDSALPWSGTWAAVHPRTHLPLHAVWGCCAAAALLGLPALASTAAFNAVTSIAVIGLAISYAVPIAARVTVGAGDFAPGPFYTGRLSVPFACLAVAWLCASVVIFALPTALPVQPMLNLNYAPVAVGFVALWVAASYFLPLPKPFGARAWFVGPNLKPQEEPSAAAAPTSLEG